MKNLCLGQIPSQEKSKQGKTSGAQLMGAEGTRSRVSGLDHEIFSRSDSERLK